MKKWLFFTGFFLVLVMGTLMSMYPIITYEGIFKSTIPLVNFAIPLLLFMGIETLSQRLEK